MKTSYEGRAALAREEGCVLTAYRDSVGVLTIGIGHTSAAGPPKVMPGLSLSLKECFELFERDLAKYEAGVNRAVTVPLKQHQFDALVSFHYNTGAIGRASFVKTLNRGDVAGAAAGMMDWNKPREIIGRRKREQRLFMTGDYGDLSGLPVWTTRGKRPSKLPLPKPAIGAVPARQPDDPGPESPPKPPPTKPVMTGKQGAIGALIVFALGLAYAAWDKVSGWFTSLFN